MAVISFDRKDFNKLAGKDFTARELEEKLPLLGLAWEGCGKDEISVELEPNHPEMLCTEGLARMFAGKQDIKTGIPEYKVHKSDYKVVFKKNVKGVRDTAAFAVVKGIRFTDKSLKSFMQLQEKLALTLGRDRSKASVGAYDTDSIAFPISYETVGDDYEFTPLTWKKPASIRKIMKEHAKGKEYGRLLKTRYPVYIDYEGVCVGMPPITNSEETKLTEKTSNIFIDVTGTHEWTVHKMLNIIVTALAERGGKIYEVVTVKEGKNLKTPDLTPLKMVVKPEYVNKLLGVKFKPDYMIKCLKKMRHNAKFFKGKLEVEIAPYRVDVMHPFDLVEEIAIAHGYENFEPELSNFSTVGSEKKIETFSARIRELLIGIGGVEVMNFMLSSHDNLFTRMKSSEWAAEIMNPRTTDYTHFRNSLIPGILSFLSGNAAQSFPQNVFELDDVIVRSGNERGCEEERRLCYAATHSRAGYSDAKSVLDGLMQGLGLKYSVRPFKSSSFIEGRSGEILVKGKRVGVIGEVHPLILGNWKLENPASLFELNIEKIKENFSELHQPEPDYYQD